MTADLASIHRAELRCFMELEHSRFRHRSTWESKRRRLQDECAELDREVSEISLARFRERLKCANEIIGRS